MPAEVNTGGHWVLHCDSRANRPTIFPRLPGLLDKRIDNNRGGPSEEPRRGAPKDWRRKVEIRAREAQPITSDHRDGKSSPLATNSSARIPRIGDEVERIFPSATDRAPPRSRRRRRGGDEGSSACLASIENARRRLPIARESQEDEEEERVESRLRDDEAERRSRSDLAIADPIAGRPSLRVDRSQTRSQLLVIHDIKNLDTRRTDDPGRTRITEESSLLSSHRSCTRSRERFLENDPRDCEELDRDARSNRDRRRRDDERSDEERTGRIGQDRRRSGNRGARSFLRLAVLLFLVALGRRGLGTWSGVIKFSARPTASVLGIGAILGAVSAGSIDLTGDAGTRAERSANLSHITGASRKIQMYIKNRHLQILPDGTVNGSNDDTSDYSEYFLVLYIARKTLYLLSSDSHFE